MSKWSKKKIKDFAFTASGGTPSTERKEYWHNGTIPWINSGELSKHDIIKKPTTYITQEALDNSSAKLFPIGTVVIALTGATTGMSAILEIETSTNQSITGIFPSKEHDSKFLLYTLHHNIDKILLHNVGSAQPHINKEIVDNLEFNYPIVPEQYVISKILSTADAVIEKTQAAIAKYKAIKQGMLQDLFTRGIDLNTNKLRPRYEDAPELYKDSKLGMIPREWEEKIVDDIAKVNGRVGWKGYTVADLRDFGPLALGATHIDKENKLDLSNPIHLSMEKYIESPEIIVQFGDLLIVQRGTIGKIVVIDRQIGEATINPSMVLLNNIKINNFFLYYQLCSFIGQLQIELLTTQTGVPMISQEQIKNINLIIPKNPKETDAIAERLKNIDTILDNEKSYLQKMQSLKKGLMEDLLSGKKQVKVAEEVLTQSEN